MDTSFEKRVKIVTLREHTDKTMREIAEDVGVHYSTVSRIIRKYESEQKLTPSRKGHCGRKKVTTPRERRMILTASRKDPRALPSAIKQQLDINASTRTVRKILFLGGRRAMRPRKKQLLTNIMKKKRVLWAKNYKNWNVEDWSKVLFTDESHFVVQGQQCSFVRKGINSPLKEAHINQSVKHPVKVMFWGCFSAKGTGRLHICEGMMNSRQYMTVIDRRIAYQLQEHFPDGNGILQHDLAPCHNSRVVANHLRQRGITVMPWPGNSPDIAPIENLWAIVKHKLKNIDVTTKTKLIAAVLHVWNRDAKIQDSCRKLVESMPMRIKAVLANKGGHIKY